MRYAITLDGMIMETFDTPEEAYESAQFAYENSGIFHAVVYAPPGVKGEDDE